MGLSKIHFRSISLPSRLHPINPTKPKVELQNLKSFEFTDTFAITSGYSSIRFGLVRLAELYNSIQEVALHSSSIEEFLLEGSTELLDICNIIRDMVQMIKENVQALQSSLRRKGLDSSIQGDLDAYSFSRKKMSKIVAKSSRKLKILENKLSTNGDQSFIKEVIGFTIVIFKRILGFLSSPTPNPKGWNLVSRLMLPKSIARGEDDSSVISEVGSVVFALKTLQGRLRSNCAKMLDIQMLQRRLQNLDVCIEELEGGLDSLFRQLIRCRVKLLNILIC